VKRGYRSVRFSDAAAAAPGVRTVAITFDDGYRSVVELAFPILSRLGLVATVFVPTNFVDARAPLAWPGAEEWLDGPHKDELTPMSWSELIRLADAGWEIGSHTQSHPSLTQLDDRRLEEELGESRARIEDSLGGPCTSLAYPYGDHDERVIAAARAAGYGAGAAGLTRLSTKEPLSVPRIGIFRPDTPRSFGWKVSRPGLALRATRVWDPLSRARLAILAPRRASRGGRSSANG
jgi:peptidoglycan/xylan/chitin deacetylase (PgdA/CDA1 family)